MSNKISDIINEVWLLRDNLKGNLELVRKYSLYINNVIEMLERGEVSVVSSFNNKWIVNEYVKKAILLYFIINKSNIYQSGYTKWYDKVGLLHSNYTEDDFINSSSRYIPGSIIRKGVFIDKNAVIMPSFINIGAYVGYRTMIDTWATVGSCARVGANCHISGGVGIGGVLEPLNANPVIIEDNCFIGSRSSIVEGVIIEKNSIIGTGVSISSSTKIVCRKTGDIIYGRVPKNSVVVAGSLGGNGSNIPSLSCAVIIKKISEEVRKKTSINDILRD